MPEIRLSREGKVAWLTIDHSERLNALTPEMMAQLGEGLDAVAADDKVRAVVLTGAGHRAFASGGDISRFDETRKDYAATQLAADRRSAVFGKMGQMPKPVIAMIRGYCMGGGMALAMQTDIRFAAEGATFGIPAAKLGIAYGPGGIEKLISLVGPARSRDILYSARRIGAEEAERIGLVNRVLPPDVLEPYVRSYCDTLAENAPLSIESSKFVIGELAKAPDQRDTDKIEALQRKAAESADIVEGRKAFLEKRKPAFRGI